MTIKPIAYNPGTQTYTMVCTDYDHEFDLPLNEIVYGKNTDGSDENDVIVTPCPNDGTVSWHPVSGGAAPRDIQLMAIRVAVNNGVKLDDAIMAEMNACDRIDGPGRFQLTDDDIKALRKE